MDGVNSCWIGSAADEFDLDEENGHLSGLLWAIDVLVEGDRQNRWDRFCLLLHCHLTCCKTSVPRLVARAWE